MDVYANLRDNKSVYLQNILMNLQINDWRYMCRWSYFKPFHQPIVISARRHTMEPSDYSNEIQEDWTNRENSETICTSLKTVVEFLNRFHSSCRLRLAEMDNRLKVLERKMERLDAHTAYNVNIQEQIQQNTAASEHLKTWFHDGI